MKNHSNKRELFSIWFVYMVKKGLNSQLLRVYCLKLSAMQGMAQLYNLSNFLFFVGFYQSEVESLEVPRPLNFCCWEAKISFLNSKKYVFFKFKWLSGNFSGLNYSSFHHGTGGFCIESIHSSIVGSKPLLLQCLRVGLDWTKLKASLAGQNSTVH